MAKEKLWTHEMERVWASLDGYPRLGTIAVAHRGARWTTPLTDQGEALVSATPARTYHAGLRHASDQFEPYFVAGGIAELDDAVGANREGDRLPWHLPKAIVRWNWRDGGAWPITAVPDYSGLIAFDDFLGVWPIGGISAGVVAAILNGPVANAYLSALGRPRGEGSAALEDVPIPSLPDDLVSHLHDLVSTYRSERSHLRLEVTRERIDRCLELPKAIDDLVLKAYGLDPAVEAELLDHFAGEPRPGFERVAKIAREAPSPLPTREPEPMSPEEMAAWQRSIEEADAAMEADLQRFAERPELFDESGVFREEEAQRRLVERVAQEKAAAQEEISALVRRSTTWHSPVDRATCGSSMRHTLSIP